MGMRAKEIAERTRKELMENANAGETDTDSDQDQESAFQSEESIRDALGPFSRPETAGPPPTDEEGNVLPTANTFAHTILKVMDKYDTPLAPVKPSVDGGNFAQGKPLTTRPQPPQKAIVSYPVPTRKKKITALALPPQEPADPAKSEEAPQEEKAPEPEPAPPPEPQKVIPELTPAEKLIRHAKNLVEKLEEDVRLATPKPEPCTPHELRVLFVNDFAFLDGYVTTKRNNEMAMLIRNIDVVPVGIQAALQPDQIAEMSWNLYRYLRSMSESFIHQDFSKGLVEIMEEDDEAEHKMFEIKRLIARMPEKDYIRVKAVIGHLESPPNHTNQSLDAQVDSDLRRSTSSSLPPPAAKTVVIDGHEDFSHRNSEASITYGNLKKRRDHGASMGHMIVAGVTLKDPALDPAKWEQLTVASEESDDENFIDSADSLRAPQSLASTAVESNADRKARRLSFKVNPEEISPEEDENEEGFQSEENVGSVKSNESLSKQDPATPGVPRPSSATTATTATTKGGKKKRGLRPVPGFRSDFPERDPTTPLMPPSISPRELLAIISIQAEREDEVEEDQDDLAGANNPTLGMSPIDSRKKEPLTVVTGRPLTRLSTMTEVDSTVSGGSIALMAGSKVSTAIRTLPSISPLIIEHDETSARSSAVSPGIDIDFGDDDPDGFGWNLMTKRGLAQALFLEETANSAQAAALEIMLQYYANVFSWNTFQQNSGKPSQRTKG
ncbi:hypothetical protein HDU96_007358 [Phlyctochytrium bullatum]|nr:hypothetical protein HDU96_007358 [Phlyctochytrium bullatum]